MAPKPWPNAVVTQLPLAIAGATGSDPLARLDLLPSYDDDVLGRLAVAAAPDPRPTVSGWISWYRSGPLIEPVHVLDNAERLLGACPWVVQGDVWQQCHGDWSPNTKSAIWSNCATGPRRVDADRGLWPAPFLNYVGSQLAATAPSDWFVDGFDPRQTAFGTMLRLNCLISWSEILAQAGNLAARPIGALASAGPRRGLARAHLGGEVRLTIEGARTLASLAWISGGPILLGDALAELAPERLEFVERLAVLVTGRARRCACSIL